MFVANPQVSSSKKERPPSTPGTKSQPETVAEQTILSITPEQRYQMIAEAAYYRAERRGFIIGDTAQDWLDAEVEIDRILQQQLGRGETPQGSAKQAFQQKLEAQLKDWDAKLDELKAKAREAKTELRADYEKQLEALSGKRTIAHAKLQELRLRTEDAWEDLKGGTERAWDEMRKALDQIISRFK
jgi:hypothetical protein